MVTPHTTSNEPFRSQPSTLFISYSRVDSDFVDRLQTSLYLKGFDAWVDRRKIEGTQVWSREIERAIARCDIFLVILSPEAAESDWVRKEISYALQLKRRILPVMHRQAIIPSLIIDIQFIDFTRDYEKGLIALLATLTTIPSGANIVVPEISVGSPDRDSHFFESRPVESVPDADLNSLYVAAVAARSQGDFERSLTLLRRIETRDPTFADGIIPGEIARMEEQVRPIRLQRLHQRISDASQREEWREVISAWRGILEIQPGDTEAETGIRTGLRRMAVKAHQCGDWAEEVEAWTTLLRLEPGDEETREAIDIAERNNQWAWLYINARNFAERGEDTAAHDVLTTLYDNARYYGDPDGIATRVGVTVPPSPAEERAEAERQHRLQEEHKEAARIALVKQREMQRQIVLDQKAAWRAQAAEVDAKALAASKPRFLSHNRLLAQCNGLVDGYDFAWSPDGTMLAVLMNVYASGKIVSRQVQVWRTNDGSKILTLEGSVPIPYTVHGEPNLTSDDIWAYIRWSPDGRYIVASNRHDKIMAMWESRDGAAVPAFWDNSRALFFDLSPDGTMLAIQTDDEVQIWRLGEPASIAAFKQLPHSECPPRWSPDGALLATSGLDGMIRLWQLDADEPAFVVDCTQMKTKTTYSIGSERFSGWRITSLVWSPLGSHIALVSSSSPGNTGIISIFSIPDGAHVVDYEEHNIVGVEKVLWMPGGEAILSYGFGGGNFGFKEGISMRDRVDVHVWDAVTGKNSHILRFDTTVSGRHAVQVSPTAPLFAFTEPDQREMERYTGWGDKREAVHIMNVSTWKEAARFADRSYIVTLAWSPGGKRLAICHTDDPGITIWRT